MVSFDSRSRNDEADRLRDEAERALPGSMMRVGKKEHGACARSVLSINTLERGPLLAKAKHREAEALAWRVQSQSKAVHQRLPFMESGFPFSDFVHHQMR